MKRIQFKHHINAPAGKVYKTMLGIDSIDTYNQWTAIFDPTSTYEGTWKTGTKMYFIGTDKNGEKAGMISMIDEHIPGKFISIRHIGMLKGEDEITKGPEVEPWTNSFENYRFEESDGGTEVTIELDALEDHLEYFDSTWNSALLKLKEISES